MFLLMGKDGSLVSWLYFPRDLKTGKPYFLTSLKVHSQNISHCFRRKLKETLSGNLPRANRRNSVRLCDQEEGRTHCNAPAVQIHSLPVNKASYFKHV
jgi:hypothetical protein